jgi:hypothetical protein
MRGYGVNAAASAVQEVLGPPFGRASSDRFRGNGWWGGWRGRAKTRPRPRLGRGGAIGLGKPVSAWLGERDWVRPWPWSEPVGFSGALSLSWETT